MNFVQITSKGIHMKLYSSLAPIADMRNDTGIDIETVSAEKRIPSFSGHLSLDELAQVIAHIKATPAQAQALVESWKRRSIAQTMAKAMTIKQHVRSAALAGVFGKNPVMLSIMKSIADGSLPAKAGHPHGFTVADGIAYIAPSHPKLQALCYDLQITTRDLGSALASLEGAKRVPGRRLGDIYCRTIAVPVQALEDAI